MKAHVFLIRADQNLFHNGPQNIFSARRSREGAQVSIVLSAAYLNVPWIDYANHGISFICAGNGF